MPDRTKTLTSAVFATALAGTVLMSAGCAPARAADGCLRVPNHQTSTGGHWYYRVDRQNQRKCWYLADEARKSDQAVSARPSLSSKKNSPRAAERIPQSIADARAELPLLTYTEPFMDGPLRYSPEEPVLRGGDALLNSAPSGDGEPMTTSAVKGASTDAAPQVLPTAANHQPAATLPVDESAMPTFRLTLSLLLVAMGLGAVTGAVVFKRSDPVSARLNDDPFYLRDIAGEPEQTLEEMTSDEMTSLALARDIPLFLLHGRLAPD
jgi:hypothetical protein